MQLLTNNVSLYVYRGKNSILYTPEKVVKKYGVTPEKMVEWKALVGDKSDNIEGIRGIGKKTASKILECNSIYEYLQKNEFTKIGVLLKEHIEQIKKNKMLITLNRQIPIATNYISKLPQQIYQYKTYQIIEKIGER